jgi:phospholipid/cholesterol/gamma-HCH transport system permease protein
LHRSALLPLRSILFAQIYFTGVQALSLVALLGFVAGAVVVFYSIDQTSYLTGVGLGGKLLYLVVFKELGTLLVGLIVIARSISAIASELGNMKAGKEIESLWTLGINPITFLVLPRIVGGILSLLLLTVYLNLASLAGGYLTSYFLEGVSLSLFLNSFLENITKADFFLFFLKIMLTGMFIFSIACSHGLSVEKSHHEVPRVATTAVVNSILCLSCLQFLISFLLFIINSGARLL